MNSEQYEQLKRTLTPQKIEVLLCLVELKTIRCTSQKLGLSSPRISLIVSRLEQTTNMKIFAKRAQTFALSEEGEQLILHLKKVQRAFSKLEPKNGSKDQDHDEN